MANLKLGGENPLVVPLHGIANRDIIGLLPGLATDLEGFGQH
jgi:hypothetical protein